ncbi:MAG: hypothetical protein IJ204_00910 [Paludibacteraceae bacterium]|nr:hypothetical protein [Paludibacteraceae bacterium]
MKHFRPIHYALSALFAAVLLTACSTYPSDRRTPVPVEYTSAYQEIYGHCYDSVPYAVVALDLYSDSLYLDVNHRMQGTGYNLYISDIFVPDSLLAVGEYHSLPDRRQPVVPYTFLPGRDWDGTPTGIYRLYVEQGKLQSIQLLDSGTMVVRDTTNGLIDISFTFYYHNTYGAKATYNAHYQGALSPWLKK